MEQTALLNGPPQAFLNYGFAAEKATSDFVEMSCRLPKDATQETLEFQNARENALRHNLPIITGSETVLPVLTCQLRCSIGRGAGG